MNRILSSLGRWCAFLLFMNGVTRAADEAKLAAISNAEQIQNTISSKLAHSSAESMKKQLERIDRIVQDIQRSVKLPPERLQLLRIGVAGVVTKKQDTVIANLMREVERRTKGATPKAVEEIMKGYEGNAWPNSGTRVQQTPYWKSMIERLLSAEERKKWNKVLDERMAYRAQAIAELVMEKIKDPALLTDDQQEKLRPLIAKAAADYLPDLMGTYGEEDSFYVPYAQALIKGIADKDAKAIIPPEQWKKWESAAGEQASEWEWIQRRHESRMKGEDQE